MENEKNLNTNIFVVGHKDFNFPKLEGYKKILVGSSNNKVMGNYDFFDNVSINISNKNKNYCELTALYWVWKNIENLQNVGFCHYRRVFSLKKINEDEKYFIKKDMVDKYLTEYDIILPNKVKVNKTCTNIYESFTANSIKKEDILNTKKVINDKYPEYIQLFEDILKRDRISFANMFITSKEIFDDYCNWLFDILFSIEEITDYTNRTNQQMRVYGYLSEILLNLWVEYNKLNVKFINTVKLDEKHDIKYKAKLLLEKIKMY